MKYYAVTEDPNELFHYGVKGMKWGQHLFGKESRPKSAAYKRAASKLRSSMKSGARSVSSAARAAKNTIQKGAMQIAYNNRARQDRKYQKAVLKAQRSNNLTQALSNLDKENRFKKQIDLDRKREAIADKLTSIKDYNDYKSMKKSVKAEKKMPKLMQEAREGTLKYGKLSEEQIGRVQDRLALEASTRRLGSTEAPKFKKRMKMAVQEGLLQGTTRGIATGMEEVAKAKVQNKMKNRRQLDKQNENRARREHEAQRIRNEKSAKETRQDIKQEAYEAMLRSGKSWNDRTFFGKHMTVTRGARELNSIAEENERKKLERGIAESTAKSRAEEWNKYLSENGITETQALSGGLTKKQRKGLTVNEQRELILTNNTRFKNAERLRSETDAYTKFANDQHNAKLYEAAKEAYKDQTDAWDRAVAARESAQKENKEITKANKEAHDKWEQEHRDWERDYHSGLGRATLANEPKEPKPKKLVNVPDLPSKNPPTPPAVYIPQTFSLEEYNQLRNLGLYSGNQNNGGKKNPKKK